MDTKSSLRSRILEYLRGHGDKSGVVFGIADAHANIMKELYPSEERTSPRHFSERALLDEALDELIAEGFIEKRENGRYFLTEKGEATHH